MKTKEIIAIGLVALALLAGCSKEKESTSSTTKIVTTPAPSGEPATTKTQESTSTTESVTTPAPAPAEQPATTKTRESTSTTTETK
ncbi:hypothetical protein [Methylomicrobium lacus]|uniref:hypothetical protein n=1 Tax=Methylomicrobium lacus TaxID=136992 RepID=UPI0035A97144